MTRTFTNEFGETIKFVKTEDGFFINHNDDSIHGNKNTLQPIGEFLNRYLLNGRGEAEALAEFIKEVHILGYKSPVLT